MTIITVIIITIIVITDTVIAGKAAGSSPRRSELAPDVRANKFDARSDPPVSMRRAATASPRRVPNFGGLRLRGDDDDDDHLYDNSQS